MDKRVLQERFFYLHIIMPNGTMLDKRKFDKISQVKAFMRTHRKLNRNYIYEIYELNTGKNESYKKIEGVK
jgi:hypothetical protein